MSLMGHSEEEARERSDFVPSKSKKWTDRIKSKVHCEPSSCKRLVPIVSWLPNYPFRKYIVGDVISGLTTAIVRIPQGLAYGLLAGLLPINGLYTGFFSPLVYTIFGTSRHISVGVFSIVSLMLGAALDKFNAEYTYAVPTTVQWAPTTQSSIAVTSASTKGIDILSASSTFPTLSNSTLASAVGELTEEEMRNQVVICSLSILIGINLLLLGIFRLGIIAMFLSEPVVSGFTTAAAIYVVTAQMKYVTGIPLVGKTGVFGLIKTWIELFSRLNEINWPSIIVSVICLAFLIPIKYVNRTYKAKMRNLPIPVELLVVITGTLVSGLVGYGKQNVFLIVGKVPRGMPTPVLPDVSLWGKLIGDAISISIIIFAVAVSLGKIFAKKHGYSIDPNQELLALGFCQITAGFLRGHSGGGALARSSVQESSGGNTQVASLVSCSVLLLVLLVIGPLFEHLPKACLACIILANLHGLLMQFEGLPGLWRIDRYDFAVWVVTFLAVMICGIDTGLAIGVVFSLICGVLRTSRAKLAFVGEMVDSSEYGDVDNCKGAVEIPGIKIVRLTHSPTYANKSVLQQLTPEAVSPQIYHKDKVNNENLNRDGGDDAISIDLIEDHKTTTVIIDCSRWSVIDVVGLSTLKSSVQDLTSSGINVYLAAVDENIYHKLERYGIIGDDKIIPAKHNYHSVSSAVEAAKRAIETLQTTTV